MPQKTTNKGATKKESTSDTAAKKKTTKKKSTAKKSTKKSTTKKKATKKKAAKKSTTKKKATKKKASKKGATKKKASKKTSDTKSNKESASKSKQKAADAAASAMRDIIARARDHFKRAHPHHVFVLRNGETLTDLRDLAESLEEMQQHVFDHHVTDDKHDFAAWVAHVLEEEALAQQLSAASKDPQAHQRVIYRYIVRRTW